MPAQQKRPALRLGVAGLGTVGASLIALLQQKQNVLAAQCGRAIEVVAVCARDPKKDRGVDLSQMAWFTDATALAKEADIDVFVELIGGDEGTAREAVEAALERGVHVVTANKALLAKHGMALAMAAEAKQIILNYEAAVAGGIPIIKTMRESLSGNSISKVFGILNGTCNYILTRMERDEMSFEQCLKAAQDLGYAEADPTFDIEGNDTAHKLALLTSLAFGTAIAADDIYLEGITSITLEDIQAAYAMGYRIKLLGVAQRTSAGIEQRVHPTMVPLSSVIAQVDGATNAVSIETDLLGDISLTGPGAGGEATASAVIGDIADIAKSREGQQQAPVFGIPASEMQPSERVNMQAHEGGYFIRLTVADRTGVFAGIAKAMADNDISLESIVQQNALNTGDDSNKSVILVTHATTEHAIGKATKAINADGYLVGAAQVIRIER